MLVNGDFKYFSCYADNRSFDLKIYANSRIVYHPDCFSEKKLDIVDVSLDYGLTLAWRVYVVLYQIFISVCFS